MKILYQVLDFGGSNDLIIDEISLTALCLKVMFSWCWERPNFPPKIRNKGLPLVLMYSNFDSIQIHWRRPVRLESNQGKGYEPRGPEAKKQSTH